MTPNGKLANEEGPDILHVINAPAATAALATGQKNAERVLLRLN